MEDLKFFIKNYEYAPDGLLSGACCSRLLLACGGQQWEFGDLEDIGHQLFWPGWTQQGRSPAEKWLLKVKSQGCSHK